MSTNSYIYHYLYRNNYPVTKSETRIVKVLIIALIVLILFFIINPIKIINNIVATKNEQLSKNSKKLYCDDGRIINYTGKYPLPTSGVISTDYGVINQPVVPYKINHNGIDIAGKIHENVIAIDTGVVTDFSIDEDNENGKYVEIKHNSEDGEFYSFYSNLSEVNITKGMTVKQGDIIGKNGGKLNGHFTPGIQTNRQLHFEIRNNLNQKVDPRKYVL